MITIREQIVASIIGYLSQIKKTNGYQTDLGARVEQWHHQQLGDQKMPMIAVLDGEDAIQYSSGTHDHRMTVEIVCFAASKGTDINNTMRTYLADLYRCVGIIAESDGKFYDIVINADSFEFGVGAQCFATATINCSVSFNTRPFDAYTIGLE